MQQKEDNDQPMEFQDDISMPHTYIHTDKPKPICPHYFKVGGHKKQIEWQPVQILI